MSPETHNNHRRRSQATAIITKLLHQNSNANDEPRTTAAVSLSLSQTQQQQKPPITIMHHNHHHHHHQQHQHHNSDHSVESCCGSSSPHYHHLNHQSDQHIHLHHNIIQLENNNINEATTNSSYYLDPPQSNTLDVELLNDVVDEEPLNHDDDKDHQEQSVTASNSTVFTWLEHNYNEPTSVINNANVAPTNTSASSISMMAMSGEEETTEEIPHMVLVNQSASSSSSQHHIETVTTNNNDERATASSQSYTITTSECCDTRELNRMLSCYCLLERMGIRGEMAVKLTCSVCHTRFESLEKLSEHKQLNKTCLNGVRFGDGEEIDEDDENEDLLVLDNQVTSNTTTIQNNQGPVKLMLVQINDEPLDELILEVGSASIKVDFMVLIFIC